MSENIQKTLWWYIIGEICYNYIIIHKHKHFSKKKWVWNEIVKQFATKTPYITSLRTKKLLSTELKMRKNIED